MLILSRKAGEKLFVGENITIEVTRVRGNRVTLGISAPADIHILRDELRATTPESCIEIECDTEESSDAFAERLFKQPLQAAG